MSILGIDLGTTFSAASIVRDGKPIILPVNDARIMPSVVGVSPDGQWLVGKSALNQWALYPEATVRSIKRQMGTDATVQLAGQNYTPPQISALILMALKDSAQQQLDEAVSQVVITVPAYFSDAQRQATYDAGELAGLDVVRIINEPTAAALAYGLEHDSDEIALVYDLGGGTFDVSLVELSAGVVDVRASHGNTRLGGDDFDERLANWLIQQFEDQHGVDLRGDRKASARIQRAAEQAKRALSSEPYTWVREEYLVQKRGRPLHMEIEISRARFLGLIDDLLVQTMASVERVLREGKIERPDHVMLVGGSTYIPAIWDMVAEHIGITPRQDVNPSEAVAFGAAIQGAIIAGQPIDAILVDITPYSLGIDVAEFSLLGHLLIDRFKVLIHRNTTIPTTQEEVFTTLHPDQDTVNIKVYQGESRVASENTLLGEFLIENLEKEPDEELAKVTVRFDIDSNGMLNVEAIDRGSRHSTGITVQATRQHIRQNEIASAELPALTSMIPLPGELLAEAEVLLARAALLEAEHPEVAEAADKVRAAWIRMDADTLRDTLEELTDVLFDIEE
jgi:molecular chaperone DnaK